MEQVSCIRRLGAELVGTAFLLATIVGSGLTGSRLAADGADVLVLGPHALATGGVLFVMIRALGPISGAHFNPAVTLAFLVRREIGGREAALYMLAQVLGGIVGVLAAHVTFSEPAMAMLSTARSGFPLWLDEALATAGLVGVILATAKRGPDVVAGAVGVYIAVAIYSTASTCFANPAVTVARMFTDSVTGIEASSAPAFIVAQVLGAVVGVLLFGWLLGDGRKGES